jgi:molybdate transport system regulatory protein
MQTPIGMLPGLRLEPRLRVYVDGEMILGWGKILLLRLVKETGSIAEAARRMEISYNHAWGLIRVMNAAFKEPLVETVRGGKGKGGASITNRGDKVLQLYEAMAEQCVIASGKQWQALRRMLRPVNSTE